MSGPGRAPLGSVDYLVNAFTPDREPVWRRAIEDAGLAVKVRSDGDDSFAEADDFVARMDELGIQTVLCPTIPPGTAPPPCPVDFPSVAAGWAEVAELCVRWPGRFGALVCPDPSAGMAGVRSVRACLERPWVVGLYLHTHSWDRRLDHADHYPYYALCSEMDVPFVFQAGAAGGLVPSECGRPIGVDRPALYFPETRFVASHLGWPWVEEALAMALKFPNVFLGTASYPPRHWPEAVQAFVRGPGRRKVLFGSNFPTVGHRRALGQVEGLGLPPETVADVLGGTARRVFPRLAGLDAA
ncbi:MAG: amidohydrolase [Acidimicrobiales bacterium]|nr:amidohydrolase [Acidimicrobiales bacterium]